MRFTFFVKHAKMKTNPDGAAGSHRCLERSIDMLKKEISASNLPHTAESCSSEKLPFLDGIRGCMALNVILCHFVCVYFPQMYFQYYADTIGGPLSLFANTPLSVLVNGNIAVQYFFTLTGFLVGRSFFTKAIPSGEIASRSVKRYFRLLPVVLLTTLFTFATMVLRLQKHLQIADSVMNGAFLTNYCNFDPSWPDLLINIFVYPFIRYSAYVGPFWTIRYEFFGYILSMVVCLIFRENKFRKLGYAAAAVLCFSQLNANYVPFLLGVFAADLQYNQNPDFLEPFYQKWIHRKITISLLLLLGLYFACCPMYFTSIYAIWGHVPKIGTETLRAFGVALVLYALLQLPRVQHGLSHPFLLFLGRYSFEVFAIHWPIMLSFQAWLFSVLIQSLPYAPAAVLAFLITIPVIYCSAVLMAVLVKKLGLLFRSIQKRFH